MKFFDELSQEHNDLLFSKAERKLISAGEVFIHEGEQSDSLYLIERGEVSIFKENESLKLATLGEGELIGDIGVISKTNRTASVKALTELQVLVLTLDDIKKLDQDISDNLFYQFVLSHLKKQNKRLINTNNSVVEGLKERIRITQDKLEFSSFFITLVTLTLGYTFLLRLTINMTASASSTTIITSSLLLVFGGIVFVSLWKNSYPMKMYGLTLDNGIKNTVEAILWTIPFIIFITLSKWFYIYSNPELTQAKLFSLPIINSGSIPFQLIITIVYILFTFVQEFIARGAILGSLLYFLEGRGAYTKAVLLSTLSFTSHHLHLPSFTFAIVVFLPGLFWGIMFIRQRSLVGVTVSHALIGVWALKILGFHDIGLDAN